MDGRRRTDDGPLVYYKLTLGAFDSDELINTDMVFSFLQIKVLQLVKNNLSDNLR